MQENSLRPSRCRKHNIDSINFSGHFTGTVPEFVFNQERIKTGRSSKKGKIHGLGLRAGIMLHSKKHFEHPKFVIGTGVACIALAVILLKIQSATIPELNETNLQ